MAITVLEELGRKPYASTAALLMFRFFVAFNVGLKANQIDPDALGDNVYNILNSKERVFPIAREFDLALRHSGRPRKKFSKIVDRYLAFCEQPLLCQIQPQKVFAAI